MIRQLDSLENVRFSNDYYDIKTAGYVKAYGLSYDFCRLYDTGKGHVLVYNANAVISGGGDVCELRDFIEMTGPQTVECPVETGETLDLHGYEKHCRTLFEIKRITGYRVEDITDEPSLKIMSGIIGKCFEGTDAALWHTDMSHRIRHGVSRAYMYKNSCCLSVDFSDNGMAFISCLATLPESRGKGFAACLMSYLADNFPKNTRGYLWAEEEAAGYYRKLKFNEVSKDIIYKKTN